MVDTYSYAISDGHGLPHDPFKAIVAPRPIGWISTRDAQGRGNLAPYSFFNAIADDPPVLAFGSVGRKDTLRNVEATAAFVYNVAAAALADAMNGSAAAFGEGEDELRTMGLTPAPCRLVDVDRVAESPASLECRLLQIVRLRDLEGHDTESYVVFGQVVAVHINRACLVDGLYDTGAAAPLMRAGYLTRYAAIDEGSMRDITRPSTAEDAVRDALTRARKDRF